MARYEIYRTTRHTLRGEIPTYEVRRSAALTVIGARDTYAEAEALYARVVADDMARAREHSMSLDDLYAAEDA